MTEANIPPTDGPDSNRRHRAGTPVIIVVCAVTALLIGTFLRPTPGRLPERSVGDQQLAAAGRAVVGSERSALALACVTPGRIRTAVIGADVGDRFELGSISKGLTGLLFQTMIDSGEIDPDARLGDVLPVQGPLAAITLTQLATHSSGLPSVAAGIRPTARGFWSSLTAANPYGQSVQQMIAEAERTPLTSSPGTYSNLGFELLGAALSSVSGRSYPDLLRERVLGPMGMTDTLVPLSSAELDDRDLIGRTVGGRRAEPWLGPAITPVGGVRADIDDTARLAQQLLTSRAPGRQATTPRTDFGRSRIGLAWITTTNGSNRQPVIWHNGGTGGFTSFVGVDRASGTGVVILSAVQESPDHATTAGFELLRRLEGCRS